MSHNSEPSPDDLQFALQEVRTLLLQQILATETGLLSVAELKYRNRGEDDINEENIRYHLREMEDRDIVAKEEVPNGQRVRDLPYVFFTVTDYGEAILEQANLLAESDLWTEMYEQMERTEEIKRIERLKRQDWEQADEMGTDSGGQIQYAGSDTAPEFSAEWIESINDSWGTLIDCPSIPLLMGDEIVVVDELPAARAAGELSSAMDSTTTNPAWRIDNPAGADEIR